MKIEETELEAEVMTEEEKRELRRQRRKKNQLMARISVIIVLLIFVAVGILSVALLKDVLFSQKKQEEIVFIEEESGEDFSSDLEEAVNTPLEEEPVFDEKQVLDEVVEAVISEMTLEEKVAGVFLVRPEDITGVDVAVQAGEGTKTALEQYPVSGLIYFAQNIKSADQFKEMLGNTVSYSKYPLFLAVDEEGGEVARLAKSLNLDNVGPMKKIGE